MKLFILTSSIFYLLGMKLTHQVEIEQPFDPDSLTIHIPVEQIEFQEIKKDSLFTLKTGKTDSLKYSGSNEKTAPCYFFLEELFLIERN